MIRRMSKRFALRASRASSSSVIPVEGPSAPRNGWGCSGLSAIRLLLDEDDAQDHDEGECAHAEQDGRPEPCVVALDEVVFLVLALQAPHEAAQLALGLGLRHQRDAD